jgi:hypothetical protein
LNGVTFLDDYEGSLEDRRTILYTLDFTMKINFYGSIDTNETLITKSIVDIQDTRDGSGSRITVVPDPADASPDSDYGFNVTIDPIE